MPTLIQRFAVLSGFVLASLSAAHAGGSLPGPGYDGMPDRSLGSFGKVVVAFPGDLPLQFGYLVDLAVLPSGKMLLAATVDAGGGNLDFAVIRLNADGSLDTGFGTAGGRRIAFDRAGGSLVDTFYSMLVQPDGRILLVGEAAGAPADGSDMAVVRLTANGSPDPTFGNQGKALVGFNLGAAGVGRDDVALHAVLQADGRILLVGRASLTPSSHAWVAARLTASGIRDSSFDADGRVQLPLPVPSERAEGRAIRVLPDGDIIATGMAMRQDPATPAYDIVVSRLSATGSPDPGYGTAGVAVFDFGLGGEGQVPFDLQVWPDGSTQVCGMVMVNLPENLDMACMRLLADGTPDPDWPPVLVPFDRGGSMRDMAIRTAEDAHGRVLLAGWVQRTDSNADAGVARLRPDGSLDAAFGLGGQMLINSCQSLCLPQAERDNYASAVSVLPDGRIVVAGLAVSAGGEGRFQVTRMIGDVLFSDNFED